MKELIHGHKRMKPPTDKYQQVSGISGQLLLMGGATKPAPASKAATQLHPWRRHVERPSSPQVTRRTRYDLLPR